MYIGIGRLLRQVQVAAAHLRTGNQHLTGGSQWQAVHVLIHDEELQVVQRLADRRVLLEHCQRISGREDGTFRRTVAVVQLIGSRRRERQNLFTTDREVAQRVVVAVHGKLTAHLCGHERVCHAFLVEIDIQVRKVQTDVIAHYHNSST